MAKYYVDGYNTPEGVNSRDAVRSWQKRLGVKVDGCWGKQTQQAYERYINSIGKSDADNYYGDFDYDGMKERFKTELEETFRPSVDAAISARKRAAAEERADIDVDAASRGIESSSYVTNVKERTDEAANSDITAFETGYNQLVAQNLHTMLKDAYESFSAERARREQMAFDREKLDKQMEIEREKLNLQRESLRRKSSGSSSGGTKNSKNADKNDSGYAVRDYVGYTESLSPDDRYNLFNSKDLYWTVIRRQMIRDIGKDMYNNLAEEYKDEISSYNDPDYPEPYNPELPPWKNSQRTV